MRVEGREGHVLAPAHGSFGAGQPPELSATGAPDHAGLCLGFLAHVAAQAREDPEFFAWTLDWLPVCALAVERQPFAHPFYRDVAAATRETLLAMPASAAAPAEEKLGRRSRDQAESGAEIVARDRPRPAAVGEDGFAGGRRRAPRRPRCRNRYGDLAKPRR
jgi:hypothetical protein